MSNISYKDVISKNGVYIATPIGKSMWPMLRNRIDTVKLISPTYKLKKYDVILYQRQNGKYVLHRIIKINKDSYVLSGDNQWQKEHGVTDKMIIGVMDGFYRKEKYVSNKNIFYKSYYYIWTHLKFIYKLFNKIKRLLFKIYKTLKKERGMQ